MSFIDTYSTISTCIMNTLGIGGVLFTIYTFLKKSMNVDNFDLKKL